jgi:hypothetical protein
MSHEQSPPPTHTHVTTHFVFSTVLLNLNSFRANQTVVNEFNWIVMLCLRQYFLRVNVPYLRSWATIHDDIVHERKQYHI